MEDDDVDVLEDIIVLPVAASGLLRGGRCRCAGCVIATDHSEVVVDGANDDDNRVVPEFTLPVAILLLLCPSPVLRDNASVLVVISCTTIRSLVVE